MKTDKLTKATIIIGLLIGLSSCDDSNSKVIAKIDEASGVGYCKDSNSFIIANDEGTYYEIDKKGKILNKENLGDYDLEGVVCEGNKLIFAVEDKGILIVHKITKKKQLVTIDNHYRGKKISLFDKKAGIEGIAKSGNLVYLAKQSKKKKDSFIVVVELEPYPSKIVDIIRHNIVDTAGLTIYKDNLYMVSDKKDLLIKYDLKEKKITKKIKLPEGSWEGIDFGKKGHIYLADDDGRVVKFKKKALGL
ncbi:MAG: SdiA-regulated domain-containing protein [Sulfurovum sp.]